ncbi:hypothetical protein [Flavobacterium foetidum]|nr:hypothetical protein [Flavobacterium foetidum]
MKNLTKSCPKKQLFSLTAFDVQKVFSLKGSEDSYDRRSPEED